MNETEDHFRYWKGGRGVKGGEGGRSDRPPNTARSSDTELHAPPKDLKMFEGDANQRSPENYQQAHKGNSKEYIGRRPGAETA